MSAIFGAEVGTKKVFAPGGSADWAIKDFIKKGEFNNVVLYSFSMADQEVVDVRRCFQDVTHIFAFGRNAQASVMGVSLLMFLFDKCRAPVGNKGTPLKIDALRSKYEAVRVYKRSEPLEINIDDTNVKGFLVKMTIDDVNPATGACVATFTFILDQEV